MDPVHLVSVPYHGHLPPSHKKQNLHLSESCYLTRLHAKSSKEYFFFWRATRWGVIPSALDGLLVWAVSPLAANIHRSMLSHKSTNTGLKSLIWKPEGQTGFWGHTSGLQKGCARHWAHSLWPGQSNPPKQLLFKLSKRNEISSWVRLEINPLWAMAKVSKT